MKNKLITIVLLLTSIAVYSNLPPASSKVSGEGAFSTTFNTDYGNIPATRNGSTITIGTIPVSAGGTGSSDKTSAMNALSPLAALGDTLYHDGTNNVGLSGNTTTSMKFLSQTGDGVNSAAPSWQTIPTTGILTFMLSGATSDIATYYQAPSISSYTVGALATTSTVVATTPTLMGVFATNIGFPNITTIPVGLFTAHYQTDKVAGANNYYTYYEVYKRTSGGVETLIATSDNSSQSAANTIIQQFNNALVSSPIALLSTDRIVLKIYGVLLSSSATVDLLFDDATNSRLELPSATVDATNFVPYVGATLDVNLGVKNLSTSGSIGSTGTRVLKGWFTDLQVTNPIVGSVTGNAGTVTTNANLTGPITSVGNATSIASQTGTGTTFVMNTSPTLVTPNLGTPSAATLTNATGLPISTGVSGLGTGVATLLQTFSSANMRTALTDETGTGVAVFSDTPTFTTPVLGAASGTSIVLGGTINANAILDVQSTTKAFMPPRMTTTQKNAISSPTAGMVVYDSTLNALYTYNGSGWVASITTAGVPVAAGVGVNVDLIVLHYAGATLTTVCSGSPCTISVPPGATIPTSVTRTGSAAYSLNLARTYSHLFCTLSASGAGATTAIGQGSSLYCATCNTLAFTTRRGNDESLNDSYGNLDCKGFY